MTDVVLVAFHNHPATAALARDQAAALEQRLRDATKDPASVTAADKIRSVVAGEEQRATLSEAEGASLVAVLALALPDLDEPLRQLYLGLRDEARDEQA
jgi:hypothetical protein